MIFIPLSLEGEKRGLGPVAPENVLMIPLWLLFCDFFPEKEVIVWIIKA